jgi:hypothetical protein
MQQRQLRLGDILDDYCPRERRLTNHAIVAMVGDEVKQTRCTTCDAEHGYKHARVPRQRRKSEPAALYSQVAAGAPKKVVHEAAVEEAVGMDEQTPRGIAPAPLEAPQATELMPLETHVVDKPGDEPGSGVATEPEGPVHRPLIRAQLPRTENQPPARPAPDFTIRQPGGRNNRFRQRHSRGGQGFQGNRSGGNFSGDTRGGPTHHQGGRPPMAGSRMTKRQGPHGPHGSHRHPGPGGKRSK